MIATAAPANPHEQLGRERKAHRLADAIWAQLPLVLRANPSLASAFAQATETDRRGWADVAGVHAPSDATWSRLIEILEARGAEARRQLQEQGS